MLDRERVYESERAAVDVILTFICFEAATWRTYQGTRKQDGM
jgi:hypothetical protein